MVLRRIFEYKVKGFYVDVGAHHPKRFSNTFLFYRRGWSGINIDAMPGSMRLFTRWRPRDINLEIGVAQTSGNLDYYVFNEPALNGFSANLAKKRDADNSPYSIERIIKINVLPLKVILERHLPDCKIDFLSIDVEGFDLDVLKSNDWSRFRPTFVLVEMLESSLHEIDSNPIAQFMKDSGYVVYAKQVNTVFFKDSLAD